MTEYYRGSNREHATFWVGYRQLSFEGQFFAFIGFYKKIAHAVEDGTCTLQSAGRALEPGYYDKAIQSGPHGGDMTIVCNLAAELAGGVFENQEEARADWEQIRLIMSKYT